MRVQGRPRYGMTNGQGIDETSNGNIDGSGHEGHPGSGYGYGSDEKASADEGVAGNSDEEEDLWPMSRPHVMSSTGAAPALPESLATNKSMLPGGISVASGEQRSITSYRMPFGGRKKKYRLNREYFRRLINTKNARGASPSNQQVDKA